MKLYDSFKDWKCSIAPAGIHLGPEEILQVTTAGRGRMVGSKAGVPVHARGRKENELGTPQGRAEGGGKGARTPSEMQALHIAVEVSVLAYAHSSSTTRCQQN